MACTARLRGPRRQPGGPGRPEAPRSAVLLPGAGRPRPQRNTLHVDVWVPHDRAEARVEAAIAAGGRLVDDTHAPSLWILADPEGNEACVGVAGPPAMRGAEDEAAGAA
ncbi:VOC family protein [Streptomyces sp. MS1.AVA.1]|uniref:VOC family protein n=1 Tax=Streptomyces machairae TaxID=3134109 RepID=A0ABU8UN25_9ACTN